MILSMTLESFCNTIQEITDNNILISIDLYWLNKYTVYIIILSLRLTLRNKILNILLLLLIIVVIIPIRPVIILPTVPRRRITKWSTIVIIVPRRLLIKTYSCIESMSAAKLLLYLVLGQMVICCPT